MNTIEYVDDQKKSINEKIKIKSSNIINHYNYLYNQSEEKYREPIEGLQ